MIASICEDSLTQETSLLFLKGHLHVKDMWDTLRLRLNSSTATLAVFPSNSSRVRNKVRDLYEAHAP